jgi:hypothetical protein
MGWHDGALGLAGTIGMVVAAIHGWLVHRHIVAPVGPLADGRLSGRARRLLPPLLQFSTFNWFVGGLALIAAMGLGPEAKLAIGLLVASSYGFGAIANLLASRGRHPGWALYGVAVVLIGIGVTGPAG